MESSGLSTAVPDDELLARFINERDVTAFRLLVERHADMVLGVCRRILRHTQDAEDACQAAFLVLSRQASRILHREALASWLYGVAMKTASNLQRSTIRRRHRERALAGATTGAPSRTTACKESLEPAQDDVTWSELRQVLDEELQRMSPELRAPLVLCYLEGRTRDEAAVLLGWSLTTLKGRLARARDLLRERLVRRGVTASASLLAIGLGHEAQAAAAPELVQGVLQAVPSFAVGQGGVPLGVSTHVIQLAQGTLSMLGFASWKSMAVMCLVLGGVASATGLAMHRGADKGPIDRELSVAATQDLDRPQSVTGGSALEKVAEEDSEGGFAGTEFPVGKPTSPAKEIALADPLPEPSEAAAARPAAVSLPSTTIDGYTVRVQSAGMIDSRRVSIAPAWHSAMVRPLPGGAPGFTEPVAGSTSAATGGRPASRSVKPNVFVDLIVDHPQNDLPDLLVEVASEARGVDDRQQEFEAAQLPPALCWRLDRQQPPLTDGRDVLFL
ncbi:MAG: RNA polymerase sigma factor, partial [Planctomycetales bacterium]